MHIWEFQRDIKQIGWYNDKVLFNRQLQTKEEYNNSFKQRATYLLSNPKYMLKFYNEKIVSMWTENTYMSIANNENLYNKYEKIENKEKELKIEKFEYPLAVYQKAIILLIFSCSLITIILKKDKLSSQEILLLLIFMGGFLFHIIWEAKSRYIIPYIVTLIPLASISLENINIKDRKNNEQDNK